MLRWDGGRLEPLGISVLVAVYTRLNVLTGPVPSTDGAGGGRRAAAVDQRRPVAPAAELKRIAAENPPHDVAYGSPGRAVR